jgi:hypothetical protein
MKTYSIPEQVLTRIHRQSVRFMTTVRLVGIGIFVGMVTAVAGPILLADPYPLLLMLIFAVIIEFATQRSMRRDIRLHVQGMSSICIEVGADYITRSQPLTPSITFNQSEILATEEMRDGLLVIASGNRTLLVPKELDSTDYQEIKAVLASWSTMRQTTRQRLIANLTLYAGLMLIGSVWPMWLLFLVGFGPLSYFSYQLWQLRRLKGVDPKWRGQLIRALGLLTIAIAGKVWLLLKVYPAHQRF